MGVIGGMWPIEARDTISPPSDISGEILMTPNELI